MSLWRTDTHWYRPIRLTDERRFACDMERGWIAVGAYGTEQERCARSREVLWDALVDSGFFDPNPLFLSLTGRR